MLQYSANRVAKLKMALGDKKLFTEGEPGISMSTLSRSDNILIPDFLSPSAS